MIGLLCFVLAILASPFKSKLRLEAENAVLRHQLIVLKRRPRGRVRLTNNDRWFFIQLYRWFPSILKVLTIVRPETLVRWHRAGFRCLSLSKIKSEHIGGVARRELGDKECVRPVRLRARPARPSPRIDGCVPHYNTSSKTAVRDGGAALRTQQRGQGIPVGSNRSAVRHNPFCHRD